MKWDKENKDRLYGLIWAKFRTFKDQYPKGNRLRDTFLREFGIEKLYKDTPKTATGNELKSSTWMKIGTQTPARNRSHIIILDPWWGGQIPKKPKGLPKGYHYGISIPKEVAEKFLVLGLP